VFLVLSPVHTTYGAVRRRMHVDARRRTSTQDTAYAKSYVIAVFNGHKCDGRQRNATCRSNRA